MSVSTKRMVYKKMIRRCHSTANMCMVSASKFYSFKKTIKMLTMDQWFEQNKVQLTQEFNLGNADTTSMNKS